MRDSLQPINMDPRYLNNGEYDDLRKMHWNYRTKRLFGYIDLLRERLEATEQEIEREVECRVNELTDMYARDLR